MPAVFGGDGLYTPQIVVDGAAAGVGSPGCAAATGRAGGDDAHRLRWRSRSLRGTPGWR